MPPREKGGESLLIPLPEPRRGGEKGGPTARPPRILRRGRGGGRERRFISWPRGKEVGGGGGGFSLPSLCFEKRRKR